MEKLPMVCVVLMLSACATVPDSVKVALEKECKGVIKAVMGFRQFLLRGLDQIAGEWNLVCMAYNISRLHALSSP